MLEIFSKVTVTEFRILKVHTKTMKAHCDSYSQIGRRVKSAFPALQWTYVGSSHHGSLVLKEVHWNGAKTRGSFLRIKILSY